MITATTHGQPKLQEGKVVIHFGLLDADKRLTEITVDVDPYAIELIRDLAATISAQADCEGIA